MTEEGTMDALTRDQLNIKSPGVLNDAQTEIPGGNRARLRPMSECERIFDRLAAPREGALRGVYRGRLAGLPRLESMPNSIRLALAAVGPRLRFPWYGKGFAGSAGANVWLSSTGRFQRYSYDVTYEQRAAVLSYDRATNPRFLRGLQAELRPVAPGRFLCRALMHQEVLLYFTLEA